jgi:hypothetical protein
MLSPPEKFSPWLVHDDPDGKPASQGFAPGCEAMNAAEALHVTKEVVRLWSVIWIFQFPRLFCESSPVILAVITIAPFVLEYSGGVPPSDQPEMMKSNDLILPLAFSSYVLYAAGETLLVNPSEEFRVKVPLIKQVGHDGAVPPAPKRRRGPV